jgi:cell shape-determining protein MreC
MSYLPKNRTKSLRSRKVLTLVALFLLLGGLLSFFDSAIISAVSRLWRAENEATGVAGETMGYLRTKGSLIEENESLKERLASLELELSTLSLASAENERLLSLLGRRASQGTLVASVLTYPPQSPYDLIIIDAGTREGVLPGSSVALPEGPEIGVVEEAMENFSRVKLYSTSGEITQAVLERTQTPVELLGSGAGNFKIVVPRDIPVEAGDRVLSAKLDAALLAVVEEINLEATDSFKDIFAKSPTNIFNVRFVTVLP